MSGVPDATLEWLALASSVRHLNAQSGWNTAQTFLAGQLDRAVRTPGGLGSICHWNNRSMTQLVLSHRPMEGGARGQRAAGAAPAASGAAPRPANPLYDPEACRDFNTQGGCTRAGCLKAHRCSVLACKGTRASHTATTCEQRPPRQGGSSKRGGKGRSGSARTARPGSAPASAPAKTEPATSA